MPVRSSGPFPRLVLPDLRGREQSLAPAWAEGPALIVLGHSDCKTTRDTLPYVDRIHWRRAPGAQVLVVLQDAEEAARGLVEELGLELPILLEPEPYPLARALGLGTVPTLFATAAGGEIAAVSEGFRRSDLEAFAQRLGAARPLFAPDDAAPALRPG